MGVWYGDEHREGMGYGGMVWRRASRGDGEGMEDAVGLAAQGVAIHRTFEYGRCMSLCLVFSVTVPPSMERRRASRMSMGYENGEWGIEEWMVSIPGMAVFAQ